MIKFSEICNEIANVSSKLEKVKILAKYLKDLNEEDLAHASLYFTGNAFSARDTRKLNLGGQMIKKALAQSVDMTSEEDLKKIDELSLKFSEPGELAEYVLENFRKTKSGADKFSLVQAERFFNSIYETSGSIAKVNLLADLYKVINPLIAKYITKILAGDLRIGLKEASVEDAIAQAFDEKPIDVKTANMLIGDVGEVAVKAKKHDLQNLSLTPFWPVKAMLATPAEDNEDILKRMGQHLWVEDKYDGVRCQVHKFDNVIRLYSRDQNEITKQFPEIVEYMKNVKHDIILDGEIMAFRNNEIMRFFFLQKRLGRKDLTKEYKSQEDNEEEEKKLTGEVTQFKTILDEIPVEYFVYDILYLDGKELLNTPLNERREIAEKVLGTTKTKYNDTKIKGIHFSHKEEVFGSENLEKAFDAAKARVTEGLMVKKPTSLYKPGRRGIEWLKYKKALEPLDVVITGVEYGHGKKREFLSDYTFAVRDTKTDELVNIGKAFSGVTDEEVKMLTDLFLKTTVEVFGRFRTVKPEVVLEVMFESIQKSQRYKSGYALRFPRITKIRIGDKGINDISTLKNVADMYKKHFEGEVEEVKEE